MVDLGRGDKMSSEKEAGLCRQAVKEFGFDSKPQTNCLCLLSKGHMIIVRTGWTK